MDLEKIAEVALRAGYAYFFHRRHRNLTPLEGEGQHGNENNSANVGEETSARPAEHNDKTETINNSVVNGNSSTACSHSRENAGGDNSVLLSEAAGGNNSNLVSEAADSYRWRDKKKFFKLIDFSYDLSLNVVRAFIESNILKDYNNSLENFLNTHKHTIYHLWIFDTKCCIGTCTLYRNRELRKDQLTKLYDLPVNFTTGHYKKGRGNSVIRCCACGINVRNTCSLKDLDIILIHTIIRHSVNLQPDEDMWLNTIRDIRNKLAHVESTTGFDEGRLDKWWQMLEGSVLGLAGKTPSFYYNTIESQVYRLKKSDFDISFLQEILDKLKAENKQFHDDITRDIRQVSRFLTDELIQHVKEIKDVVVDFRNLSIKVAPPRPPQLQIQNLNAAESCDIQDSNICYVQWKLDTPNSWQVEQIKDTLEKFSAMLHLWFKVEFVYIGSLIIVTTVPKHVIMDRQSFEEAVRAFLDKFVEVCGIDTNCIATLHVELTLLQDFNDDKKPPERSLSSVQNVYNFSSASPDIRAETQNIKIEIARNTEGVRLKVEEIETKMSEVIPANIQGSGLKVEEIETKMSEVIPANIQDQIKKQLELWQKQDKMYVSTGATEHVLECITENSCVTVTGNLGVGKTFLVRHVALIMKGEGYTVVPTCIPKDIRNFTKPGSKTLFVVDDIGGYYTLNKKYLDDWKLMLSDITLLLENNQCKIIATCRLQVFKDEKFKDLSIFLSNECNLNSEELCLTSDEKVSLAKKYFDDEASKVSQMSYQYEFFPLLCSLYDKNEFSDLSQFFSQPFDCYKQELDHLLSEGDEGRYKYCVLALVVMFNNKLSKDHLSGDNSKIIENTLDQCKLNKGTPMECLKDALHTLEGTFVVKDNDCYKTLHDQLFYFLANYFGDKMLKCIINNATSEFINERILWNTSDNTETDIEFSIYLPDKCLDMYISRLVNDWSDGKVVNLFDSRNIDSPTFIVKLLHHIKQHDKSFQVELANITVDNIYHDTTLLLSCFVGDVNLTQWILDNTVYNLHVSVLDRLLECKADINKCRDDGTSPVYIACQNGHLSVLDRLIECKADINKCRDDGTSPVYIACQNGHLSVLDRLIECKADINKCRDDGTSPVYIACQNGHLSVLDRLIGCKADINKCKNNGALPIYIACQEGHLSVLDRLIECKADINKCKDNGASPVYIACQNGHLSVLDRLIECKADINKCRDDGTSPVYIACQNGHLSVLDILIECKADINKCKDNGASPVYIACQNGHLPILDRLIECKADINKCKNNDASPVYIACQFGHLNILNTLLESKSDVNKCETNGFSPLHVACYNNRIDVVLVLLKLYKKNKVIIDLCDDLGNTPLHDACEQGFVQIITPLLQHGANPHQCNKKGKSPLQVADDNGHVDVVIAIKEFIPITV